MNANWIRVLMFAGYKPFTGKMLSFLTTHSKVDPKKGDSWVQKLGIMRRKIVPEHLYVGEGMRDLIELVNDYKPDCLCFRKNVLVRMALYAKKHDMKIHQPKVYTPVSEMVDAMTRKLMPYGMLWNAYHRINRISRDNDMLPVMAGEILRGVLLPAIEQAQPMDF